MPFKIIRNDITKMKVDAIVNPTNPSMFGTAGVDGAIHSGAGIELREETSHYNELLPGEVKLTDAYNLPSRHIIHTVGPLWIDGKHSEEQILRNCYGNALSLAKEKKFKSIAFPLIATGTFGYPKDKALRTAIDTIGDFLLANDMKVYLVVYDRESYRVSEKLFSDIEEYISNNYVNEHRSPTRTRKLRNQEKSMMIDVLENLAPSTFAKRSLEDLIENLDETFSEMLLRLIDERDLKDSVVYKKANVTKQTFSKIRNNVDYNPTKPTVLAFAIAIELSMDETEDLLKKAGLALSASSKFDIIISYFIENEIYNIFEINEVLFNYEQQLLGV